MGASGEKLNFSGEQKIEKNVKKKQKCLLGFLEDVKTSSEGLNALWLVQTATMTSDVKGIEIDMYR